MKPEKVAGVLPQQQVLPVLLLLFRLLYLDHRELNGSGLYAKACEFDLEGIVAKWKDGSCIADDRRSSWVKIKNPHYSQLEGREELFEAGLAQEDGYAVTLPSGIVGGA